MSLKENDIINEYKEEVRQGAYEVSPQEAFKQLMNEQAIYFEQKRAELNAEFDKVIDSRIRLADAMKKLIDTLKS